MKEHDDRLSGMGRQELLEHYEEIKAMASRDALTGLLNRGALESAIRERLSQMKQGEQCALFIIDLDNFKEVNDNFGHQTGDQVLVKTARILSGMFRATDIVGRLGGDEFVIFLSGRVTEKLVQRKGQEICDHLQFVMGVSSEVVVTASVGVQISDGKENFEELYHSADQALYKAKRSGKQNCCIKQTTAERKLEEPEVYIPVNAVRIRSLLDYIDSGVAMEQAAQGIWEVELSGRTFHLLGENKSFPEELTRPLAFPEALLETAWVHPETAEAFRDFAEEIFSGRRQGYANFKVRYREDGHYGWAAFSYKTVSDGNGKPTHIVGVIEEMKQDTALAADRTGDCALPESLLTSLVLQVNGNLTKDELTQCWLEGQEVACGLGRKTCTEILEEERQKIIPKEEGLLLAKLLSREAFLRTYRERRTPWMTYEYRRIDSGGRVRWVSCTSKLSVDHKTGDLQLSLWISKLGLRRQWERCFAGKIRKDPVSRLYKRETVRDIAECLMKTDDNRQCALVLVEIGGMTGIYTQYTAYTEERRKGLLTALLLAFGTRCLPGEFGAERCLLFVPETAGEEALRRRLEQSFQFVRNITADFLDGSLLQFLACAVCCRQGETSYNSMMKQVRELYNRSSNSTGDRVIFASDEPEESWVRFEEESSVDKIRIPETEAVRPLSESEKDAALQCLMEMYNTESIDEASRCVLRTLGEYYEADRTYILVPVEKGTIVTMPHEWTSVRKHSIQHIVSGATSDRLPLLEKCAKADRPVFLTKRRKTENEEKEELWHFLIFPMRDNGQVHGYLCIENARSYMADVTFPALLCTCLLKERRKYMRTSRISIAKEGIASVDLPNNRAFMEAIYTFHSDVYRSLGAVCIDVPDFPVINSTHGYEYGRKLLWYLIHTMTEIFGKSMLYRTWDAEFVALCPNTTKQIFEGKCARLESALLRRYPKEIRCGFAWAEKEFTGKALVDEAKALMKSGGYHASAPHKSK